MEGDSRFNHQCQCQKDFIENDLGYCHCPATAASYAAQQRQVPAWDTVESLEQARQMEGHCRVTVSECGEAKKSLLRQRMEDEEDSEASNLVREEHSALARGATMTGLSAEEDCDELEADTPPQSSSNDSALGVQRDSSLGAGTEPYHNARLEADEQYRIGRYYRERSTPAHRQQQQQPTQHHDIPIPTHQLPPNPARLWQLPSVYNPFLQPPPNYPNMHPIQTMSGGGFGSGRAHGILPYTDATNMMLESVVLPPITMAGPSFEDMSIRHLVGDVGNENAPDVRPDRAVGNLGA
ncbi:hypothetical protein B0T19DRAFT_445760 [Cercophora scortea]|uniref:Uncharacterized protein n=1 Tax=Cercophora scortea TaxID=314031 RepID=A0AAE0M6R9_9PEZI|nr:hypothetical protein B0T19DRAFT_445760 [Cercophora scortea]